MDGIYTSNGHVDDDDNDAEYMCCSCLKTFSAAAAATMEKKRYVIIYICLIITYLHGFQNCHIIHSHVIFFVNQHNPLFLQFDTFE